MLLRLHFILKLGELTLQPRVLRLLVSLGLFGCPLGRLWLFRLSSSAALPRLALLAGVPGARLLRQPTPGLP